MPPVVASLPPTASFVPIPESALGRSVAARFEEIVARHPRRQAFQAEEGVWTYEELNRAANRAANAILERRGPENEPVALLFDTSRSMLSAVLGALKAGKAWVPLDVTHPESRLRLILEDTAAPLLLTCEPYLPLARRLALPAQEVIDVNALGSPGDRTPDLTAPAEAMAHIIYTSGSTGTPKGVVHSHRSFLQHILAYDNALAVCPDDRLLSLGSYSYQGGSCDLFRALLVGACLCPFNLRGRPVTDLPGILASQRISIYHSVPTVFRQFAHTISAEQAFPSLRYVHLGGETTYASDVALFRKHFPPPCILLNNLGATEVSTYRRYIIDHATDVPSNLVPVGYAVEGKEVLLRDEQGRPVGPGEVGEIVVRTPYAALGYWRRPKLTAEFFHQDAEDPEVRLYQTGDLGRMAPDGCLVHVGRKDSQVKIQGNRVELGEIEGTLFGAPAVKEAAVVFRPSDDGQGRLVAYTTSHSGAELPEKMLRSWLAQRLPDYMVPATFVSLRDLPRTATGKVDRNNLPEPQAQPVPMAPPRTPTEEALAKIWQGVLKRRDFGIDDDLFDLGANSLQATLVLRRIQARFNVQLSLRTVFERRTIAAQATALEQEMAKRRTALGI